MRNLDGDLKYFKSDNEYKKSTEFKKHLQIENEIKDLTKQIANLEKQQISVRKAYVRRTKKYAITKKEVEQVVKDPQMVNAIMFFLKKVKKGEPEHFAFNSAYNWPRYTEAQAKKFAEALELVGIKPSMLW